MDAESSVTERVGIVMQLEEMAERVEQLDQLNIREALSTLDWVIRDCEATLTNLEALRKWAQQPTKGKYIPF